MKRKITVSVSIRFMDGLANNPQEALEVVKSVLCDVQETCEDEIITALEGIGASEVEIGFTAY